MSPVQLWLFIFAVLNNVLIPGYWNIGYWNVKIWNHEFIQWLETHCMSPCMISNQCFVLKNKIMIQYKF